MTNENPGERIHAEPIASEKIVNERKVFFLDLKENQRGRFLKITEDVGGGATRSCSHPKPSKTLRKRWNG